MPQKEDDGILKNPLIAGEMYQCEMIPDLGGCGKEYPGEDIIAIAESGIKLCHSCYDKFLDMQIKFNRETKESFDAKSFFGSDDTKEIISEKKLKSEALKIEEEHKKTIIELLDEREKQIEEMREQRRRAKEAEEFRVRHREYMRKYMKDYNKVDTVKKAMIEKRHNLRDLFNGSPVIDKTTPECPRCGNPKCGKAGYIINTFGKFQRRKCPVCLYAYTDDWRS